jgi:pyrimidine operon attenuation protein/uracil phosphoribosyltransferase
MDRFVRSVPSFFVGEGSDMTLREKAKVLGAEEMSRVLRRIAHEIVERNRGTEGLVLVGIQRRGVPLSIRLAALLREYEGVEVPCGELDITLYRDDLTLLAEQPVVRRTLIPGGSAGKRIVLVDDVIYTGRTVRAALEALIDLGRPESVRLGVLIDRGHRELPIQADFVGKNLPTSRSEVVEVRVSEIDGRDEVVISERD